MGSPSPSPLGRESVGLRLETEGEEKEMSPSRGVWRGGDGDDDDDGGSGSVGRSVPGRMGEEPKTPRGPGVGVGAGMRVPWGTPGSLYDQNGFLKD